MKYIYQIIVSVCLGCMAISCGKHLVEYGEYYKLNNQSGHTVSIMHNPSPELIPDSLVLKNQQEFNLPLTIICIIKAIEKFISTDNT